MRGIQQVRAVGVLRRRPDRRERARRAGQDHQVQPPDRQAGHLRYARYWSGT